MRILLVEDEKRIAAGLMRGLAQAGYVVDVAHDGEDGWFRGDSEPYDAIILDLGLPTIDGVTILKRWREAGRTLPVIILTARDGWRSKVDGIDAGADDYLTKPFRIEELLARLRAVLRRRVGQATSVLTAGRLEIDTVGRVVKLDGAALTVTALEYRLLTYLAHRRGHVLSQSELSEHIYEQDIERDSNAVEALVGRLRRKLGEGVILTRRGHGYVLGGDAA
ncbi:MAG: response regulator transcription factor [Hyphomicrobiales bacterium]